MGSPLAVDGVADHPAGEGEQHDVATLFADQGRRLGTPGAKRLERGRDRTVRHAVESLSEVARENAQRVPTPLEGLLHRLPEAKGEVKVPGTHGGNP